MHTKCDSKESPYHEKVSSKTNTDDKLLKYNIVYTFNIGSLTIPSCSTKEKKKYTTMHWKHLIVIKQVAKRA